VADPLHLLDEQVDRLGRAVGAAGGPVPGQDLGLPGGRHLAETITGSESRAQPRSATAGELFGGCQQQLGDPVQRIVLAPAVTKEGLLGPPAGLVDHRVGQLDGVEVIDDHGGVASGATRALA
jgi:hypothetical protein